MANEIAIPEPIKEKVSPVVQKFLDERARLFEMTDKLRSRDLSPLTVAMAVECDTQAKAFAEKVTTAFDPMVSVAHQTHRSLTAIRGQITLPVAPLRELCSQIVSDYRWAQVKKERETAAPAQRAEIAQQSQAVLAGVATTQVWEGEVENFADLVDYIAAHHELLFLLLPVQGDLNRYLTRMKGKVGIPGVKVIERMVTRNRNSDAG